MRSSWTRRVPQAAIRARIEAAFGPLVADDGGGLPGVGPARYLRVAGGGNAGARAGIISAVTEPFCETCNRVRLTCTGTLYMCLGQEDSSDFRPLLRAGVTDDRLDDAIREAISRKPKGHDFIIDRRHDKPAVARHMSVTGG